MDRLMNFALRLTLMFCIALPAAVHAERPNPDSPSAQVGWQGAGTHGAVAAGGAGAVQAGLTLLKSGGNATDAAAATILALSVTDDKSFCFGGEVPILVYDAKRVLVEVVAGQGAAPRLATREYFERIGGIPGKGLKPAAVPATLDACLTLLDRYGTRTFAEVVQPTLALLDKKTAPWHADLAATLRRLVEAEQQAGADRSRGLRKVADYFYRGPLAHELSQWCQSNGGLLRYSDLAAHVTRIEDPVSIQYRGHTVYKCGPWTQGPVLLQTLQLLEGYDLRALGHNRPDAIHLAVEAMKLAFADRDLYYADPLYADIPLAQLLSPRYAQARRALIDAQHASLEYRPGDPRSGKPLLDKSLLKHGLGGPARDTTTCLVADSQGNVVAATPSGWDGVVAGKTGVWLGTRLQSFNLWPDHPNCIEPGKRPRITLTPTLVLKDGQPVLAISVAGGDGQDQATLQMLLGCIDYGLSPAEAVTAPRFGTNHHLGSFRQTPPELGSLVVDASLDSAAVAALKQRGHRVTPVNQALWNPSVLRKNRQSGLIEAAGDPRAGRHSGAY